MFKGSVKTKKYKKLVLSFKPQKAARTLFLLGVEIHSKVSKCTTRIQQMVKY